VKYHEKRNKIKINSGKFSKPRLTFKIHNPLNPGLELKQETQFSPKDEIKQKHQFRKFTKQKNSNKK
jgi:hypothetical protein